MAKAEDIKAKIGLSGPPLQSLPTAPPVVPDHEIVRCIGRGSYGEVWLARNAVGTWRAVKVVYRANFKEARPYEREFAGIQKYEPISRANEGLVDVLHIGRNDAGGYFYYVMELADDAGGQDQISSDQLRAASNQYSVTGDQFAASYTPRTLAREIHSRGRLPVEECITLGLTLNLALGYLHRHGLIHRDVKPSNIIFVNSVPKLADIGLVTDTAEAQSFVGTEGFIPPEGPNSTQADLYALGKVLYEAAMGKDRQEFPEPFTNLGVDAESRALMELNEVLLKACADKPTQRYQTAEEMNADLALLHSGKSVQSKHALERRLKLMTRIGVGAVLVLLLAVVPYYLAVREAHRARIEAERSRQVAQFLKEMLKGVGPSVAKGRDTTMLREILDNTAERVSKDLTNAPEVELDLRFILADTYAELGLNRQATELARENLQLARARLGEENVAVATALDRLGRQVLGTAQAEEFCRQALAMRIRLLGKEHADVATSLDHLGGVLQAQGRLPEAESLHRQALAMRIKLFGPEHLEVARSTHNLAIVLTEEGRLSEAESMFRLAMGMSTKLEGNEHPSRATGLENLARTLQGQGKFAEAEAMQREALTLRRKLFGSEHGLVAREMGELALTLDEEGKLAEAETLFREALEMQRKLGGSEHKVTADLLSRFAGTLLHEGKLAEAETMSREALSIYEKNLGPDYAEVAQALNNLGWVLMQRGKLEEAEPLFRRALAIETKLMGNGNLTPHSFSAVLVHNLAIVLQKLGQYSEAKTLYREVAERGDVEAQISLGQMYLLGQGTAKDPVEAVKWYHKARSAAESGDMLALNPVAWFLATCEDPKIRDGPGAVNFAEKAVAAANRKTPQTLDTLAAAYAEAGEFDKAVNTQKEAMELLQNEETKRDFASRLKLYQSKTPYRDHN